MQENTKNLVEEPRNETISQERVTKMKNSWMAFMQKEVINNKNVNLLQEVYEHVYGTNNEELVARSKSHKNDRVGKSMAELVYLDMIGVLSDKIVKDKELCLWFIEKMKNRYCDDIEFVIKRAQKDESNLTLFDRLTTPMLFTQCAETDDAKTHFLAFIFLFYAREENMKLLSNLDDAWYQSYLVGENEYEIGLKKINSEMTQKMDWTDDFIASRTCKQYIKKQIELLAAHKGKNVEELKELIAKKATNDNDMAYLSLTIMKEYGGCPQWVIDKEQELSCENIDTKLEAYYKHKLLAFWKTQVEKMDSICKLDITRYYLPECDYEHDFEIITNSIVIDIMGQLFADLTKEFYSNFSFERITKKSLIATYTDKIKEYDDIISKKDEQIQELQEDNFIANDLLEKKQFAEEQVKELETVISKKDAKIKRLSEVIRQKNEAIRLYSKRQSSNSFEALEGMDEDTDVLPKERTGTGDKKIAVVKEIPEGHIITRVTLFKCTKNNHKLTDICCCVRILKEDGEESVEKIPGGYCKECDRYFILEEDYKQLKQKGLLLCRVVEADYWVTQGKEMDYSQLKTESLLHMMGYNVNVVENLTVQQRQGLLKFIVDEGILTVAEIRSRLRWLINRGSKTPRMWKAVLKWKSDSDFLKQYGLDNKMKIDVEEVSAKKYRNRVG